MKILQIALICTILLSSIQSAKNNDENRPYEFGFTIDGEQHRYEKKDANGIIQGEFGFITADGIYHVTTYATDENGSFRILSMRNVRISDPLDGSGGTYSNKVPTSQVQSAGNVQKPLTFVTTRPQHNIQQPPTSGNKPATSGQPVPSINLIPPNKGEPAILATTKKPSYPFTTQPTIKPACAGCGYVTRPSTTTRHTEINKPYQNQISTLLPSHQDFISQNEIPTSSLPAQSQGYKPGVFSPSTGQQAVITENPTQNFNQNKEYNQITNQNPSIFGPISQNNLVVNVNNRISSQNNPQNNDKRIHIKQGTHTPSGQVPTTLTNLADITNIPSLSVPRRPTSNPNNYQQQPFTQKPPSTNENTINTHIPQKQFTQQNVDVFQPITPINQAERNRVDEIRVENGMIYVPNNPPIPIKDKYPNMVDGLPNGIEEKDIQDLLYKFNYTIGFHGHYEKGWRNGTKTGGYFVNGRDGISRVVTYVADELGYRPKFKLINLGLDSPDTPKEATEKTFGLKNFEFIWYPLK